MPYLPLFLLQAGLEEDLAEATGELDAILEQLPDDYEAAAKASSAVASGGPSKNQRYGRESIRLKARLPGPGVPSRRCWLSDKQEVQNLLKDCELLLLIDLGHRAARYRAS